MHITDINLAGLSVLSFLALYFPSIGIIETRRKRKRVLAQHANSQIERLVEEETKRLNLSLNHECIPDYERGKVIRDDERHVYISCHICKRPVYCGLSIEVSHDSLGNIYPRDRAV